jgi:bifunctional non-homologous end joining protein LigD
LVTRAHRLGSIIVGYYKRDDLIYVARVRNGFVPASRRQVFGKLKHLEVPDCPFVICQRSIVDVGARE